MEVAALPSPPANPEPTYDGDAEATRSAEELFQWSTHLHVGAGAAECEHGEDGACADPHHFHAWVCLPNTFQMRDIGEKAQAAMARKKRAMRDPEADSYAVLEDTLDDLKRTRMDEVIDGAAKSNVNKRLGEIIETVREDERFAHQDQDAEELRRLEALPEEERDSEEYTRLQAQVAAYAEAFEKLVDQEEQREHEALEKDPDRALDIERQSRIEAVSREMYMHTYYTWSIYVGTRQPVSGGFPSQRKFKSPEDLKVAPPEVVTALRDTIGKLEDRTTAARSDAAGNS
ncbi:MAG TPA: hypothetical protein VH109_14300 [Steroidobacteraceae bacterium]|jgi:hypothetical protein|nr:hypothetical protein [Steroidobacteraceae bacterium]